MSLVLPKRVIKTADATIVITVNKSGRNYVYIYECFIDIQFYRRARAPKFMLGYESRFHRWFIVERYAWLLSDRSPGE